MSPALVLLFLFLGAPLLCSSGAEPLVFKHVRDHSVADEKKQGPEPESSLLGKVVPFDTPIMVGQGSRIEVESSIFLMRVGASSEFQHRTDGGIALDFGSILIQPSGPKCTLNVSTKKCRFSVSGRGTFILETTSNGGGKLMPLTPGCEVTIEGGAVRALVPGNLLFLLPQNQQFGPVLNIDLSVLLSTSALINRFPTPLSGTKALRASAFFQMYRIKSRSNALIGDARDANNYDVVFVK